MRCCGSAPTVAACPGASHALAPIPSRTSRRRPSRRRIGKPARRQDSSNITPPPVVSQLQICIRRPRRDPTNYPNLDRLAATFARVCCAAHWERSRAGLRRSRDLPYALERYIRVRRIALPLEFAVRERVVRSAPYVNGFYLRFGPTSFRHCKKTGCCSSRLKRGTLGSNCVGDARCSSHFANSQSGQICGGL